MKGAMHGLTCKNSMWTAWDDLNNVELNVEDVKAAQALELEYVANEKGSRSSRSFGAQTHWR